MANFWDNDPVANAPTAALPAIGVAQPAGGGTMVVQPNVAHETSSDSDMLRAAAAGGATGPLIGAGAFTDLPQTAIKGGAVLGSKAASLVAKMMGNNDLANKIAPSGAAPYPAVDYLEKAYSNMTAPLPAGVMPGPMTDVLNNLRPDLSSAGLRKTAAGWDTAAHRALGNENYQSPFTYQPNGPREQLAYNIAAGATSNPATPVSGALGAGASTMAGDVFKGTPLEVPAELLAGGAAAGAPTAASRYLPSTTAEGIIQKMTADVTPKQWQAAQDLQKTAQAVGVPLTGAEAMQQAVGQQGRLGTLQRTLENSSGGEPSFRPMMAARPAAVDTAGQQMLNSTFGARPGAELSADALQQSAAKDISNREVPRLQSNFDAIAAPFGTLGSPETTVKNAQQAAQQAIIDQKLARTGQTETGFNTAEGEHFTAASPAATGLDAIIKDARTAAKQKGVQNPAGATLNSFADQLEASRVPQPPAVPDPADVMLQKAGLSPGTAAYNQAKAKLISTNAVPAVPQPTYNPGEAPGDVKVGNLMGTYIQRRQQIEKSNPLAQDALSQPEQAALRPFVSRLRNEVLGENQNYEGAAQKFQMLSKPVNELSTGAVGRIADKSDGSVGGRLNAISDEVLSPNTSPNDITKLMGDLGKVNPSAMPQIVRLKLQKLYDDAQANMTTPQGMQTAGTALKNKLAANPGQRANIQALVYALPNGKAIWPQFSKSLDNLETPDYGAMGRIAGKVSGDPGTRLSSMAEEFLSPNTRPLEVRSLAQQINKIDPNALRQVVGTHIENLFNDETASNMAGANPFGGAKFANAIMGNPQKAENFKAVVESLDAKAWPGVQKFMQVMQATGKRKGQGSETQMNQEMQAQLNNGTGAVNFLAKNIDPFKLMEAAGDYVGGVSARMNAKQLSDVLTSPDAVKKMQEMAIYAPNSARAKLIAAQALQLANPSDQGPQSSAQNNGTRETSPAAPAPSPQGTPAWQPPETDQIYAPAAGGPVSAMDRDSAIRTMYGEAGGEGPDGQAAVAHVILNRARSGKFGQSVHDVVLAPHQFEPWNDPRERTRLQALRPDSPMYQQLGEIFDKASMGELPDNTKGATHFVAAQLQRARGRAMPDWARKDAQLAQIGGHTFYAP